MAGQTMHAISTSRGKLNTLPIKNGQLILVRDSNTLYFDWNNVRTEYVDIIQLDTERKRTQMVAPIVDHFYYVKETNVLWFYSSDGWKTVGGALSYSDLSNKPIINGKTIENDHNGAYYGLEELTNKVTEINEYSTDNQYPTALSLFKIIGEKANLETEEKTNLVKAINELVARVKELEKYHQESLIGTGIIGEFIIG